MEMDITSQEAEGLIQLIITHSKKHFIVLSAAKLQTELLLIDKEYYPIYGPKNNSLKKLHYKRFSVSSIIIRK